MNVFGLIGIFHYAVKVGDEWYEIGLEGRKKQGKRSVINGSLNGKPRSDWDREEKITGRLSCVGATDKTNDEILAFNRDWIRRNPTYCVISDNCQKYAEDLIRFLVGGSFKMGMPLCSLGAWVEGPSSHEVSQDGYTQSRTTKGKFHAQLTLLAIEGEGPAAGFESYESNYVATEASLLRVEAKVGPAAVRLEPNLNSAVGVHGGQFKIKCLGFGITLGKGAGIHTPLGSIGFGNI